MMVTEIHEDAVVAAGWRIPAHTIIWAAGNLASPLLRTLGAPLDRQGRVMVEADCTVPAHPEIFVLGDAAHFAHDPAGMLPGVCPVAMQMGTYAAKVIRSAVGGRPERRPFHYWNKGELAVIGRGRAVANIRRLRFGGMLAWLAWIFVHIFFLIGFRNRLLVMIEWAISYLTYSRGARLITGRPADRPPTPADASA